MNDIYTIAIGIAALVLLVRIDLGLKRIKRISP